MNAKQNKSRLFSVQLRLGNVFSYLVLVLLLFITIAPLWWVVRTALTSPRSIYTQPSSLTPINPTTQNFERVLGLIEVKPILVSRQLPLISGYS
jgi:ABC-type glycerol-3-phosphate transport system permease component